MEITRGIQSRLNQFLRGPLDSPYSQNLMRWRWIILVLGPIVVTALELLEGHALDLSLAFELLLYGILPPVSTWLLLTKLAYDIETHTKHGHHLAQRRQFTQQLAQCQDWDELTRFIVRFPATTLPVDRTALFIYDLPGAELRYVTTWSAAEAETHNACLQHNRLCYTCRLPRLRHIAICEYQSCPPVRRLWDDVCVPLTYDGMLIGLLRLGCQDANLLTAEQTELLNDFAPEIALALVRLIAIPGQMEQVRTNAQAYERRQIAQTLHNSLAQQIGYLHLSLDRLSAHEQINSFDDVGSELRHMRDVAGEAYKRIRDTLAFLRSQEQADLAQAIADYAQTVAHETGLPIAFTTHGEPRPLSPHVGSRLFSLVQECLNNVQKHAQAQQVHIAVHWLANGLRVTVSDDGIGFDVNQAARPGHYGLAMMRENITEIGGALMVDSAPGQGAQLQFTIPQLHTDESAMGALPLKSPRSEAAPALSS